MFAPASPAERWSATLVEEPDTSAQSVERSVGGPLAASLAPSPRPTSARSTHRAGAAPRADRAPLPWRSRIVGEAQLPPAELVAHPANWRRHPAAQRAAINCMLGEVGWIQRVIRSVRTGRILDGHARVEEALARAEPTIPVVDVDVSEDEERLILAAFDPLGTLATADTDRLAELLALATPADDALAAALADLADEYRLVRPGLVVDPDLIPLLPTEAELDVKRGDVWQLGDHRICCGDATDPDDVARLLAGAAPTLLVTGPPWGVSLDPAWRDRVLRHPGRSAPRSARGAGHRAASLAGDIRVDWSAAYALVPSLTVGYVWHAAVHAATVAEGLKRIGFELVAQIIWDRGFVSGRGWYGWAHEPAWVVRKAGAKAPFYGARNQASVWRGFSPTAAGGVDDGGFDHPAHKPVLLYETPIGNHLRPGEAVYDPFAGSGTAIVAAERVGRRCYAMELNPRCVQLAVARWEQFTGRKAVRA